MAQGQGHVVTRGYSGTVGATRTERLHFTGADGGHTLVEVYRCVNVESHPELGARLIAGDLNQPEPSSAGAAAAVPIPVLYHDPNEPLFVLVLPAVFRHRELPERIALLQQLDADREHEIPAYVREFLVVYGGEGLRTLLESRQERERRAERLADLEAELVHRASELEERQASVRAERVELDRLVADMEERRQGAAAVPVPVLTDSGTPLPTPVPHEEIETNPFELMANGQLRQLTVEELAATGAAARAPLHVNTFSAAESAAADSAEAITADQILVEESAVAAPAPAAEEFEDAATSIGGTHDLQIERWIVSQQPTLSMVGSDGVRLAATASDAELELLLAEPLAIRIQLHKFPTYPVVALVFGPNDVSERSFFFLLDIGSATDREVMQALARDFTFLLDIYDREYVRVKERAIIAQLSDNAQYVLSAADAYLRTISDAARSFADAKAAWSVPEFDRCGLRHASRAHYREELFDDLESRTNVWAALQMVSYFGDPDNEEYLLLTMGESLVRWHHRRSRLALRAVELGLWPGTALAQLAVSEGAARSRKDLVQRLQRAFAAHVAKAGPSDLSDEIIEVNWRALHQEAQALGVRIEGGAVVSGTIGADTGPQPAGDTPSGGNGTAVHATAVPVEVDAETSEADALANELAGHSSEELIAMLEDKDNRRGAAMELCRRAEPQALAAVFQSLQQMTRSEAVQVLGNIVKYGDAATPHLVAGLQSHKGFLRHGCSLALAVLKAEIGIDSICDLLLSEPTEIWREVARSVGELGSGAVMTLAARLQHQPESVHERVAWALAHVASRGGRAQVDVLADGSDPLVSGVARHALELADLARSDNMNVRGPNVPRDQTVNRAFSRKFFEAKDRWERAAAMGEESGAVALDEADLIEDDAEPLDESDLIPT